METRSESIVKTHHDKSWKLVAMSVYGNSPAYSDKHLYKIAENSWNDYSMCSTCFQRKTEVTKFVAVVTQRQCTSNGDSSTLQQY